MAVITKELALKIAKKLKANIKRRSNKAHDIAEIYHEGNLVTQFGIRRGSNKNLGHDHIPRDLHIQPREARLLAECPLSRDDWLDIMTDKGKI